MVKKSYPMNSNKLPLYEALNTVEANFPSKIPPYIINNLRFSPRNYQKNAILRWNYYFDHYFLAKNQKSHQAQQPLQLLFNMATGSGKTYVMAALILDLYRRGYRDFVFFVGSVNILEKTHDNFINSGSNKYLFNPELQIFGHPIRIREVENFCASDPDAINIIFTTTQRLHHDLQHPHENRLTSQDLAGRKIVFIADEAHHNNAKLSPTTKARVGKSWEETISDLLHQSPDSILLEFTATLDFEDPTIREKYLERTIYRYDLRAFRDDKYSKDVLIFAADNDLSTRMLQAIIISQFRKILAEQYQIWLKPVVLFKSRTVCDSKANQSKFIDLIAILRPEQITELRSAADGILRTAFEFFDQQGISDADLCRSLQQDFHPDNLLAMDGSEKVTSAKQRAVNTLELAENPYRAIFAVDMLKEGWDVLNLFDIVRLYETQGSSKVVAKTTISEAQLIGRGARYYPFEIGASGQRFQRKFDDEPNHPLRVLEQLHYHTSHGVRYINDIKDALDDTGITNFAHHLGPSSISQKTPTQPPAEIKTFTLPQILEITMPTGQNFETNLFNPPDDSINNSPKLNQSEKIMTRAFRFGSNAELTPNIIHAALNRHRAFSFANLQRYGYTSRTDFIADLSKMTLNVSDIASRLEQPSQSYKLKVVEQALEAISQNPSTWYL